MTGAHRVLSLAPVTRRQADHAAGGHKRVLARPGWRTAGAPTQTPASTNQHTTNIPAHHQGQRARRSADAHHTSSAQLGTHTTSPLS